MWCRDLSRLPVEIPQPDNRPFPLLRSELCFLERQFPLLAGVVLRNDGVCDFELGVYWAMEAGGIALKLLRRGFTDWAKEGAGHLSTLRPISDTRKQLASQLPRQTQD